MYILPVKSALIEAGGLEAPILLFLWIHHHFSSLLGVDVTEFALE